jgi:hypothetical protein
MVGHDGTAPSQFSMMTADNFSPFTVHVEDLAGNPIQGSIVVIDMSACTDVQFCEDQLGNSTADCPTMTVRKTTDVNGDATFNIIGGALIDIGDPDGSPCDCVEVFADGVNIVEAADEPVTIGAFDLDNDSGVGGADLTLWLDDFGSGSAPSRSDYDHDQLDDCLILSGVGGADLTIWLDCFGNGASALSCADLAANKCTP